MRRSGDQFSGPESSLQIRSLADFITTTSESRFSVHTGGLYDRRIRRKCASPRMMTWIEMKALKFAEGVHVRNVSIFGLR